MLFIATIVSIFKILLEMDHFDIQKISCVLTGFSKK